ncbi:hypothetical protein [Streptomyces sp. NPDC089795]|uniref:hypothetical protein n=1 Tax=Streptomyces sp. NPDC089795 TaxID=3155297 RepID=UPI003418FC8F
MGVDRRKQGCPVALDAVREELPAIPDEDTGDSKAEFIAVVHAPADLYRSREIHLALPALLTVVGDDSGLRRLLTDNLVEGHRAPSPRTRTSL